MTVTFRPDMPDGYVMVSSPYFNSNAKESVWNCRLYPYDIYPNMNISNINAGIVLREIQFYNEDLCDNILIEYIESFIENVVSSIENYRDPETSPSEEMTKDKMLGYLYQLEKIAKTAKHLNVSLTWS